MSRAFIIFGLAVLVTPATLPEWLVVGGGASFGVAVMFKLISLGND